MKTVSSKRLAETIFFNCEKFRDAKYPQKREGEISDRGSMISDWGFMIAEFRKEEQTREATAIRSALHHASKIKHPKSKIEFPAAIMKDGP